MLINWIVNNNLIPIFRLQVLPSALIQITIKMSAQKSQKKYDFTGKVALVTGSNSGIGEAIALQLAQYGAMVTIHGREDKTLKEVSEKIKQISGNEPLQVKADLLDRSTPAKLIQSTIDKYGRLDILVNNAGGGTAYDSLAHENMMDGYDKVFDLNVRSVFHLTQLAVPHLEKTQGNVINISSIAAIQPKIVEIEWKSVEIDWKIYSVIYSSSKAALDMFTKTSAQELGKKGIRVNSINPGPVLTRISRSFGMDEKMFESIKDRMAEITLLKKFAYPVEIANLASFLASPDAANITGSIIVSDTGCLVKNERPNLTKKE